MPAQLTAERVGLGLKIADDFVGDRSTVNELLKPDADQAARNVDASAGVKGARRQRARIRTPRGFW